MRLLLCIAFLFYLSAFGSYTLIPQTPLFRFEMNTLGDNGHKAWGLKGDQGIYCSENKLQIVKLQLQTYLGDPLATTDTFIESPKAFFFPQENRVSSDATIAIYGNSYQVAGTAWDWESKTKHMRIHQNVRVVFFKNRR